MNSKARVDFLKLADILRDTSPTIQSAINTYINDLLLTSHACSRCVVSVLAQARQPCFQIRKLPHQWSPEDFIRGITGLPWCLARRHAVSCRTNPVYRGLSIRRPSASAAVTSAVAAGGLLGQLIAPHVVELSLAPESWNRPTIS